ncbi:MULTISPECIES: DUF2971 domain-containing protein [Rhizobium/Agrobacterium group]|uniref:DUF2971 domain-containing protein n=1 Tax=Rhizobium/Agrobacterium group TaxID=227290 RepID=UPI00107F3CFC|nr:MULTISPECIES: DUF2971 domain-containing protein [Rhizobium/Agrobacterium group]MBB4402923.1 hypothetical protein [Agrobacterium radiobacter]MBB5589166.1 hypothetical protein [Agrobacterium radiobacter]TGE85709.1 DUF2971 domain-containing protein [Rhizobium sp. SEMIA 4032]
MSDPNVKALSDQHPERIYKYRSFSNRTIEMLVEDTLFYADPSTFNDPLDTRPMLKADVEVDVLQSMLRTFVERRTKAEMEAAAETIRYRGPKTLEHILKLGRTQADKVLQDIAYNAGDPAYEVDDPETFLLRSYSERELLRQYDKGVVSMSERWDSPLMWSHYGDQHRGICIGYSIPDNAVRDVRKVQYGGGRIVAASLVASMLQGDVAAQQQVDDLVLLRKAEDWGYECEWRLIGNRGSQDSPLELEDITFGIRCDMAVKFAIVQALMGRQRPPSFFEMHVDDGTFNLRRRELDIDELKVSLPRRSRQYIDAFDDLPDIAPPEAP